MNKVFVYGILLGREGAKEATLWGFEKFFRTYATIKINEDEHVNGELILVDDNTLEEFDRIEGVANGYYHRFLIQVELMDETVVEDVWVYQQVEDCE